MFPGRAWEQVTHSSSSLIPHPSHVSTAPWTVGRLLQWTADYLKSHGSESPRLDAEVLLAKAMKCQRIELYTAFDDEPSEEVRAAFRELVRRRAEGTPVAYLVGHREFYSLDFRVTPDVLIPRPETELLVSHCSIWPKSPAQQVTTYDNCRRGHRQRNHRRLCRQTLARLPGDGHRHQSGGAWKWPNPTPKSTAWPSRIEFVQSDLFAAVAAEKKFDFILSNPPYVASAELDTLAAGREKFRAARRASGRPARHRSDRITDSAIGRAAESRRIFAHGNQPHDSRQGSCLACSRDAFRACQQRSKTSPACRAWCRQGKGRLQIADS